MCWLILRRILNGILKTYSPQVLSCFSQLKYSKIIEFHTPLTVFDSDLQLPLVAQVTFGYRYCAIFKKEKFSIICFHFKYYSFVYFFYIPMNSKPLATFSGWWFIQWFQSQRYLFYILWGVSERVARVPTCFCPETSSQIQRSWSTRVIDLTTPLISNTAKWSNYCAIELTTV